MYDAISKLNDRDINNSKIYKGEANEASVGAVLYNICYSENEVYLADSIFMSFSVDSEAVTLQEFINYYYEICESAAIFATGPFLEKYWMAPSNISFNSQSKSLSWSANRNDGRSAFRNNEFVIFVFDEYENLILYSTSNSTSLALTDAQCSIIRSSGSKVNVQIWGYRSSAFNTYNSGLTAISTGRF